MECASLKVSVGDVVGFQNSAGIVDACVADHMGRLLVIVKLFQWKGAYTAHSELWIQSCLLEAWPADALVLPRAWYFRSEDVVVVR